MQNEKYTFWSDPGHSWLEVPREHLEELGVAKEISTYSYRSKDGSKVYLEEDSDAPKFILAYKKRFNHAFNVKEVHRENIFIRNLPPFKGVTQ